MMEFATVTKVELIKHAGGPAIKVCLCREDVNLPNKERYTHDYIGKTAPASVALRWFSMLGYTSADWDTFFNQDVFDLIGLRIQADFSNKEVEGKRGKFTVVEVRNIKNVSGDSQEKEIPVSSVATKVPDDDIPF